MRQMSFVKSTSSMAEKAMHQSTSVTILNVRIYSCELHSRQVQTTRVQRGLASRPPGSYAYGSDRMNG